MIVMAGLGQGCVRSSAVQLVSLTPSWMLLAGDVTDSQHKLYRTRLDQAELGPHHISAALVWRSVEHYNNAMH